MRGKKERTKELKKERKKERKESVQTATPSAVFANRVGRVVRGSQRQAAAAANDEE